MKRYGEGLFFGGYPIDAIKFVKVYGAAIAIRHRWDTTESVGSTIENNCFFVKKEVLLSSLLSELGCYDIP